jgi:hypothetical protein
MYMFEFDEFGGDFDKCYTLEFQQNYGSVVS